MHALLQVAAGIALGDATRETDGIEHLPGHEPGDPADHQDHRQAAQQQCPAHEVEGLLLVLHREQVVQRVRVARAWRAQLAADHDSRIRA